MERSNHLDEAGYFASITGLTSYYHAAIPYKGGQYGIALLSKFPILDIWSRNYDTGDEAEPRAVIAIRVKPNGDGDDHVWWIGTHLDLRVNSRMSEIKTLLRMVTSIKLIYPNDLILIAGDFNDNPNGTAITTMLEDYVSLWRVAGHDDESGYTFPSWMPTNTIDYLFADKASVENGRVRVNEIQIPAYTYSDHRPIWADLDILH